MIRCIFDKAECNSADSSTKREWKYNDIFGLNVKGVADAGVYWSADAFMPRMGQGNRYARYKDDDKNGI